MIAMCPKCKVKLKIADEKIAPGGTRFKCPKCSAVLLIKKPAPVLKKLDAGTIMVAHEEHSVRERLKAILSLHGYKVLTAVDGIEAMVTTTKELPFLAIIGVSIPKIYGFEVAKKLKGGADTKNIKIIFVSSVYDARRYRREPESLHNADDYIEEHMIESSIIEKIDTFKGIPGKEPVPTPQHVKKPAEEAAPGEKEKIEEKAQVIEKKIIQPDAVSLPPVMKEPEERARRLARTILSDIYLYSKSKVDESIMNNTFHKTFSSELKEGLKLYDNRVTAETKKLGDFFNDEINKFIEKRKKTFA